MGVKHLMDLIKEYAPGAIKEYDALEQLVGRTVAIDASLYIYQSLINIRHMGAQLTDADGNTTSHLSGLFYRSVRLITHNIKPIFVFDGKPPDMKSEELQKRKERREEAEAKLTAAIEAGNQEDIDKFSRRTVYLEPTQVLECQKMLTLMGIPWINAPSEAEAECAALAATRIVDATATEDMDALAFNSPILIRHLSTSANSSDKIIEINLAEVLAETGLSRESFIDLCILCGCDYCDHIKGIGYKKSYELIKKYNNLETIIQNLNSEKYPLPEHFDFVRARKLFFEHPVTTDFKPSWKLPKKPELLQFMVEEKGFSQSRIENAIEKIKKAKQGGQQTRMDSFFAAAPKSKTTQVPPPSTKKSNKK